MLNNIDSLKDKAENLVAFARHSNEKDIDIVIKEVVNFAQEQRLEILQEIIQLLKRGANETIIEERQRQEAAKLSER
jgi:hypothetical protein